MGDFCDDANTAICIDHDTLTSNNNKETVHQHFHEIQKLQKLGNLKEMFIRYYIHSDAYIFNTHCCVTYCKHVVKTSLGNTHNIITHNLSINNTRFCHNNNLHLNRIDTGGTHKP